MRPTETDEALALARAVVRQGEMVLAAQLTLAVAASQRAMTLAALFTPIAVAAFGLAISQWVAPASNLPLAVAMLATGAFVVSAAALCVAAAWPMGFYTAGNRPDNWWSDGVEARSLAESLKKESANYDRSIDYNQRVITRTNDRLKIGALLGVTSPIVGLVAAVVVPALV